MMQLLFLLLSLIQCRDLQHHTIILPGPHRATCLASEQQPSQWIRSLHPKAGCVPAACTNAHKCVSWFANASRSSVCKQLTPLFGEVHACMHMSVFCAVCVHQKWAITLPVTCSHNPTQQTSGHAKIQVCLVNLESEGCCMLLDVIVHWMLLDVIGCHCSLLDAGCWMLLDAACSASLIQGWARGRTELKLCLWGSCPSWIWMGHTLLSTGTQGLLIFLFAGKCAVVLCHMHSAMKNGSSKRFPRKFVLALGTQRPLLSVGQWVGNKFHILRG